MNSPFATWLRQRRKSLDLTQDQLAKLVGCSPETIRKFEAGTRQPSRQIAELLALHLNLPTDEHASFIQFARKNIPVFIPSHTLPPHNLPNPPTPLIGREAAIADGHRRLMRDDTHLLTLLGPPGIGKTRLSIAVARSVLDRFADGVWFVPLAPVEDSELVVPTIITTLNIRVEGPQTPHERLTHYLRDKQILLLLDNFEQILPAATLLADLLRDCPLLKILVTSRAPLSLRGERQLPLAPLSLPAAQASLEMTASSPAVALFLERAEAVQPDFELTSDNAPAVVSLCRQVDGLPLAIELIAARVKLFSPAALLERLEAGQMMNANGLRDLDPRHATLNIAIDWSYRLLDAEEQRLFQRLGIFRGGWTLEAVEKVCAEGIEDVLARMASLLDKNLLRREGDERFGMLETIRVYALYGLKASPEYTAIQALHADYFSALAERADSELHRYDNVYWMNRLDSDYDNLRGALDWCLHHDLEKGLRLVTAIRLFWTDRGHSIEGCDWLEKLLAADVGETAVSPYIRAKSLNTAAQLNYVRGNVPKMQYWAEAALRYSQEQGDDTHRLYALRSLGQSASLQGDDEAAHRYYQEGLDFARQINDVWFVAFFLNIQAMFTRDRGEFALAEAHHREALQLINQTEDEYYQLIILWESATTQLLRGNYQQAERDYAICMDLSHEIVNVAYCLEGLAGTAGMHGEGERAARMLGAAEALREEARIPLRQLDRWHSQLVMTARSQLSEDEFAAAWAAGRTMTRDQAIRYALRQA